MNLAKLGNSFSEVSKIKYTEYKPQHLAFSCKYKQSVKTINSTRISFFTFLLLKDTSCEINFSKYNKFHHIISNHNFACSQKIKV